MMGFDADTSLMLKAVDESSLLGFACIFLDLDPKWGARLENLHVRPDLKRQGIGGRLFDRVHDWARAARPHQPMHLWVLEENGPARRFYERRGGRVADTKTIEVVPGVHVPEVRYVWEAATRSASQ